jgi:hypothetical protein
VNRLTKDTADLDRQLGSNLGTATRSFLQLLSSLALMGWVAPLALPPLVVIMLGFYLLFNYYQVGDETRWFELGFGIRLRTKFRGRVRIGWDETLLPLKSWAEISCSLCLSVLRQTMHSPTLLPPLWPHPWMCTGDGPPGEALGGRVALPSPHLPH